MAYAADIARAYDDVIGSMTLDGLDRVDVDATLDGVLQQMGMDLVACARELPSFHTGLAV